MPYLQLNIVYFIRVAESECERYFHEILYVDKMSMPIHKFHRILIILILYLTLFICHFRCQIYFVAVVAVAVGFGSFFLGLNTCYYRISNLWRLILMNCNFHPKEIIQQIYTRFYSSEYTLFMYLAPKFSIQESIENGHDMEEKNIYVTREWVSECEKKKNEH